MIDELSIATAHVEHLKASIRAALDGQTDTVIDLTPSTTPRTIHEPTSRRKFTASNLHWTQRPENAARNAKRLKTLRKTLKAKRAARKG